MNTRLLRIRRKFPHFYKWKFNDELRRRKVASIWLKIRKEIDRQMDEAWGWDIDRDKYDALAVLRAEYERITKDFLMS